MPSEQREKQLLYFRGTSNVMIATNVCARGIDVPEVRIVVHFDLACQANGLDPCNKMYLYRSCRAGRCGKRGFAITLLSQPFSTYQKLSKHFGFKGNQISQSL